MKAPTITRWMAPALLAMLATPSLAVDGHEPPVNPYLADSPWPMSHRTPYAQGSSPLPGPTGGDLIINSKYVSTGPTNITLAASPVYPRPRQGRLIERLLGDYLDRQWGQPRVHWGSTFGAVYKLRDNQIVHRLDKPSGVNIGNFATATSGAYTLVDKDNTFFTVDGISVLAYRDRNPGDINSPIELRSAFELPASILRGDASNDPIVGMNLLWDGRLAVVTKQGTVVVLNRDFSEFWSIKLGDPNSEDGSEEVSNSIAADEKNGIYVVTSEAMYRVQWTGFGLSLAEHEGGWRAKYNAGEGQYAGRLGKGSGSTPSLMGGPGDRDRFVVITDGQELAHLVLFWRDEIPDNWQQLPNTESRRIAAQVPINFGDNDRKKTVSEQSVLVRGYSAVVVSNDYRNTIEVDPNNNPLIYNFIYNNPVVTSLQNGLVVTLSQLPAVQPWGVHSFSWKPGDQYGQGKLETKWVRKDVSCPNGIPTMSASTRLFYCIGAKDMAWTLEAIDWDYGHRVFRKFIGFNPLYNSFYAGTQIDTNGRIISGTTLGVMELGGN
jgi:hypothetical protein